MLLLVRPSFALRNFGGLAGASETTVAKETEAQPVPTHAPALATPTQIEHAPEAAPAHHDQPREINVDLPEEGLESGMFVLVIHEPQTLLESIERVEIWRDPPLVLRSSHLVLVRTENGGEVQGASLGRRSVPLD